MKELDILLENYWIPKDADKDLYYRIKDSLPFFKTFLTEKLGYHTIVNPHLIKLEKLPGKAESWMGIPEFDSSLEYAFLCLLLMFLEDKGKEEQFVLSGITEYLQANFPGNEKVDWTLFRHRKSLVKVLRFAAEIGMIHTNDGDEQNFAASADTEVLYESTGLSRYFVRSFSSDILNYKTYKDIENDDFMEMDRDKGVIRRHRVYRRVVMSPVVYHEGPEDADYDYIKKYRNLLEKDMETYLGCSFHVHRNGALLVLDRDRSYKDAFPENKTLSDIVLQVNHCILSEIKNKTFILKADDTISISRAAFESLLQKVSLAYSAGWSKEYREMPLNVLTDHVIHIMESYLMLETGIETREIKLLPLIGKVTGQYPEDFQGILERE